MKEQISSQEWILLSTYLDGELNPREKMRVEELLRTRPEVNEAYQSLRLTKNVLRAAPRKRVPRNFTLSAEYARQPRRIFQLIPALRLSSAVAALMSVFLVVSQLLPVFAPAMPRAAAPEIAGLQAAEEAVIMEAAPGDTADQMPDVIYWGGPPVAPVPGMGGASGSAVAPNGRGGGGGGGENNFVPPLNLQPPEAEPSISGLAEGVEPLTGSGPVLGVREPEQQGMVIEKIYDQRVFTTGEADVAAQENELSIINANPIAVIAAGGLFLLAIGLLVTALILNKGYRA